MTEPELWTLKPARALSGLIVPAADKSITHRAVMLGALAQGRTTILNPLLAEDTLCTMQIFQSMGVSISQQKDALLIEGRGHHGLQSPSGPLNAGNSGTTLRLLSGILAAQSFNTIVSGDASLSRRPMKRVIEPLRLMGAKITAQEDTYPPLSITGVERLHGIAWNSPVASAQVKSCLLLAGLYAEGETSVSEPVLSRDHSERMLRHFGAPIESQGLTVRVRGQGKSLLGTKVIVPGDISSAAFFLVAGLIVRGSQVLLRSVGVNPTRVGLLKVLKRMGGRFQQVLQAADSPEPVADLEASFSELKSVTVTAEEIPSLVDEIPILAVAATQAHGTTVISGAQELRLKETDRLRALTQELSKMGARVEEQPDGLRIHGPTELQGAVVSSHGDHRMAMSLAVAALVARGETTVQDVSCVATSYPQFLSCLQSILR